jgi:hypothetical protein
MQSMDAIIRRRIAVVILILGISVLGLASAAGAVAATAEETQTLASGEGDSLCVAPVSGFAPTVEGAVNLAPLSTPHNGPFPDSGSACGVASAGHASIVPASSQLVSGLWTGALPGASWIAPDASGEDHQTKPPTYYIYGTSFALCPNQVADAQVVVHMFADDVAGAFLDGVPIGHIPNLEPTGTENYAGIVGGWPATSAVGSAAGFQAGTNRLQFVVLDSLPVNTGLDFAATVAAPACQAPVGHGQVAGFGPAAAIQAPAADACLSARAFTIHIRPPGHTKYRKVTVKLNGHPIHVSRGRTRTARIDLRGRPRGAYKLTITIVTRKRTVIRISRTYHTCGSSSAAH